MGRFDKPQPPPDPLAEIQQALATLAQSMERLSIPPVAVPAPNVSVSPPSVNVDVPTEGLVDALSRAVGQAIAALPPPETPQIALDRVTADVDLMPLVEAAQEQRAVLEALQEKLSNMTAGRSSHFDGRLRHEGRVVAENNPLPVITATERTAFGEEVMVSRTPVFALSSLDPISILRDYTVETGSGTVTTDNREFLLDAPGVGDIATLESALRGRYVPGYVAEVGEGVRLGSRAAGASVRMGGFDGTDGFYFEVDDNGLSVHVVDDGTEIYSEVLDISNRTDDVDAWLQEGRVLQIRFIWYGYGVIEFGVVGEVPNHTGFEPKESNFTVLHRVLIVGQTSVAQPNLPTHAEAEDGATLYVGGRQYSIFGRPDNEERNLGHYRITQTIARASPPAFIPVIAIRRRTDADWPKGIRIIPDDWQILTDEDMIVQQFIGGTVSGGTWEEVPFSQGGAAVEVNVGVTSVDLSAAIGLEPLIVQGTGNSARRGTTRQRAPRLEIPREEEFVLCVKGDAAGTDATVTSVLDWLEIR